MNLSTGGVLCNTLPPARHTRQQATSSRVYGERKEGESAIVGCCLEGLGRWCWLGVALPTAAELGFTGGGASCRSSMGNSLRGLHCTAFRRPWAAAAEVNSENGLS